MKAVHVSPINQNRSRASYTYFSAKEIHEGDLVRAVFRKKEEFALVTSIEDIQSEKTTLRQESFSLKKITAHFETSFLSGSIGAAARTVADFYAVSPGIAVDNFLPDSLRTKEFLSIESSDKQDSAFSVRAIEATEPERIVEYKKIIESAIQNNSSIIILTPTSTHARRLGKKLEEIIDTTIHLGGALEYKKKKSPIIDALLKKDTPLIIIGTASVLLLPVQHLETIIIEDESSPFYENPQYPYIDARIMAAAIARARKIELVLAATFLRVATSAIYRKGSVPALPKGALSVIKRTTDDKKASGFKTLLPESIVAITKAIEAKKQVFIFAYKKNYASLSICRDCGEPVSCPNCSHALLLKSSPKESEREFVCGFCHETYASKITCKTCGSWNILPLGVGIARIQEELQEVFLNTPLYAIDGDTSKGKAEKIMTALTETPGILIGNDASFPYLPDTIDTIIVASLDTLLALPSYDGKERLVRTVALLKEKNPRVHIVQTSYEAVPIFEELQKNNLGPFFEGELQDRRTLLFPPFGTTISITISGSEKAVVHHGTIIKETFAQFGKIAEMTTKQAREKVTRTLRLKLPEAVWNIEGLMLKKEAMETLKTALHDLPPEIGVRIGKGGTR